MNNEQRTKEIMIAILLDARNGWEGHTDGKPSPNWSVLGTIYGEWDRDIFKELQSVGAFMDDFSLSKRGAQILDFLLLTFGIGGN